MNPGTSGVRPEDKVYREVYRFECRILVVRPIQDDEVRCRNPRPARRSYMQVDSGVDFGSEGWGFESSRARFTSP
jgi:hypothetical protein